MYDRLHICNTFGRTMTACRSVALGRPELFVLLSQSPDFWDYRHAPPHQVQMFLWDGRLEQSWGPGLTSAAARSLRPSACSSCRALPKQFPAFLKVTYRKHLSSRIDSCARKACTLSQFLRQVENIKVNGRQVQDLVSSSQS